MSTPRGTEQASGVGDEVRRLSDSYQHADGHQGASVRAGGQRQGTEAVLQGSQGRNRRIANADERAK